MLKFKTGKLFLYLAVALLVISLLVSCQVGLDEGVNAIKIEGKAQLITEDIFPFDLSEYALEISVNSDKVTLFRIASDAGEIFPAAVAAEKGKAILQKGLYTDKSSSTLKVEGLDKDGKVIAEIYLKLSPSDNPSIKDIVNSASRDYENHPNGLYIIEGTETVFYSMDMIDDMTIEEMTDLISMILDADEDEVWFVLANYHGYYSEFTGGVDNWPENDEAFDDMERFIFDKEEGKYYDSQAGEYIDNPLLALLTPEEDAQDQEIFDLDLTWEATEGFEGAELSYEMRLWKTTEEEPVDPTAEPEEKNYMVEGPLDYDTAYTWSVIVKQTHAASGKELGTAEAVREFTTRELLEGIPELVLHAPADGAQALMVNNVQMQWAATPTGASSPTDTVEYELYLWKTSVAMPEDPTATPEDETHTVNGLDFNTEYAWQVKAIQKNAAGVEIGTKEASRTFTTTKKLVLEVSTSTIYDCEIAIATVTSYDPENIDQVQIQKMANGGDWEDELPGMGLWRPIDENNQAIFELNKDKPGLGQWLLRANGKNTVVGSDEKPFEITEVVFDALLTLNIDGNTIEDGDNYCEDSGVFANYGVVLSFDNDDMRAFFNEFEWTLEILQNGVVYSETDIIMDSEISTTEYTAQIDSVYMDEECTKKATLTVIGRKCNGTLEEDVERVDQFDFTLDLEKPEVAIEEVERSATDSTLTITATDTKSLCDIKVKIFVSGTGLTEDIKTLNWGDSSVIEVGEGQRVVQCSMTYDPEDLGKEIGEAQAVLSIADIDKLGEATITVTVTAKDCDDFNNSHEETQIHRIYTGQKPEIALIAPIDELFLRPENVRFEWEATNTVEDATLTYDLYLDNNLIQEGLSEKEFTHPGTLEFDKEYKWYVIAKIRMIDSGILVGQQRSETGNFKTTTLIEILFEVNDEITNDPNVLFGCDEFILIFRRNTQVIQNGDIWGVVGEDKETGSSADWKQLFNVTWDPGESDATRTFTAGKLNQVFNNFDDADWISMYGRASFEGNVRMTQYKFARVYKPEVDVQFVVDLKNEGASIVRGNKTYRTTNETEATVNVSAGLGYDYKAEKFKPASSTMKIGAGTFNKQDEYAYWILGFEGSMTYDEEEFKYATSVLVDFEDSCTKTVYASVTTSSSYDFATFTFCHATWTSLNMPEDLDFIVDNVKPNATVSFVSVTTGNQQGATVTQNATGIMMVISVADTKTFINEYNILVELEKDLEPDYDATNFVYNTLNYKLLEDTNREVDISATQSETKDLNTFDTLTATYTLDFTNKLDCATVVFTPGATDSAINGADWIGALNGATNLFIDNYVHGANILHASSTYVRNNDGTPRLPTSYSNWYEDEVDFVSAWGETGEASLLTIVVKFTDAASFNLHTGATITSTADITGLGTSASHTYKGRDIWEECTGYPTKVTVIASITIGGTDTLTGVATEALYTVTYAATDLNGNTVRATKTILVDTKGPELKGFSGQNGLVSEESWITFQFDEHLYGYNEGITSLAQNGFMNKDYGTTGSLKLETQTGILVIDVANTNEWKLSIDSNENRVYKLEYLDGTLPNGIATLTANVVDYYGNVNEDVWVGQIQNTNQ